MVTWKLEHPTKLISHITSSMLTIPKNEVTGRRPRKSAAYIQFKDASSACVAFGVNGSVLNGNSLLLSSEKRLKVAISSNCCNVHNVHNYWQLLTTINDHWRLLTTIENYWKLLTTIKTIDDYWKLLMTIERFDDVRTTLIVKSLPRLKKT